jgi:hypothetical protein
MVDPASYPISCPDKEIPAHEAGGDEWDPMTLPFHINFKSGAYTICCVGLSIDTPSLS